MFLLKSYVPSCEIAFKNKNYYYSKFLFHFKLNKNKSKLLPDLVCCLSLRSIYMAVQKKCYIRLLNCLYSVQYRTDKLS